ncbi:MAG: hypothetical protein WCV83_00765 [Candidatus Magasanikbacteria bacterium]
MPIRISGGRERGDQYMTPNSKSINVESEHAAKPTTVKLDRAGHQRIKIDLPPTEKWLDTKQVEEEIHNTIDTFFKTPKKKGDPSDPLAIERSYLGNCMSATQNFGRLLNHEPKNENDKNFFDKFPRASYSDLEKKLPQHTGGEDFHSVGFIEIPHPTDKNKGYYIAIDLTFFAITSDDTRVLCIHGDNKQTVMNELTSINGGGHWDQFKFNPNFQQKDGTKGAYTFQDK